MNKDIAEKWIDALLSGDYKQGKNKLASPDKKFCCLGVLCEIARDEIDVMVQYGDNYIVYDGANLALPNTVRKWAGMLSFDGRTKLGPGNSLSVFNDTNATFEDIADIIAGFTEDL